MDCHIVDDKGRLWSWDCASDQHILQSVSHLLCPNHSVRLGIALTQDGHLYQISTGRIIQLPHPATQLLSRSDVISLDSNTSRCQLLLVMIDDSNKLRIGTAHIDPSIGGAEEVTINPCFREVKGVNKTVLLLGITMNRDRLIITVIADDKWLRIEDGNIEELADLPPTDSVINYDREYIYCRKQLLTLVNGYVKRVIDTTTMYPSMINIVSAVTYRDNNCTNHFLLDDYGNIYIHTQSIDRSSTFELLIDWIIGYKKPSPTTTTCNNQLVKQLNSESQIYKLIRLEGGCIGLVRKDGMVYSANHNLFVTSTKINREMYKIRF